MDNGVQKNPLSGKKIALFVVYGLVAVLLLIFVLKINDMPSILEQIKDADIGNLFLALLLILVYMALYPLSLCILTKARKTEVSMPITYTVAMTEHFFNGITPWATGGQPFQAYSFSKAKVRLSESTGLLLTNLVIYMVASTSLSLLGLFYFETLVSQIDPLWHPVIFIGYAMNFIMLSVMLLLGLSTKVRNGLLKCARFLCKFKLFKRFEPRIQGLQTYFEQVQDAFHDLTKKKGHFILALISKITSLVFFYLANFFILRAMHIEVGYSDMLLILAAASFVNTAVGFIPTPGASGGAEGATGQVFKSVIIFLVGGSVAAASVTANGLMLIWRLLSYYFVMLVSLISYIGLEIYFSKKSKINK